MTQGGPALRPSYGPVNLDALCGRCGQRQGVHTSMPNSGSGGTCPDLQDWYCRECSNTGVHPADWDTPETDCDCCANNNHYWDAEEAPPCVGEEIE